jgi:serine/threonine-protein kinase
MLDNKLKLIVSLGVGASAQTFKARVIDKHLANKWDKIVAVKIPLDEDEEKQDLLINDVVNMARIQGILSCLPPEETKHLVRFYGCEKFRGSYVMISEFIDGADLHRKIGPPGSPRAFSMRESISCVTQVCQTLGVLHRAGIFHRDLKPSNILVLEGPEGVDVRLTDFGMSTILDRGKQEVSNSLWGALAYMPPELMINPQIPINPACDLYSLGLVLYELCCGKLPFDRLDSIGVVEEATDLNRPFRHPHDLSLQVPDCVCSVIIKAVAKQRDKRYQTAEEMSEDLLEAKAMVDKINTAQVTAPPEVMEDIKAVLAALESETPSTISHAAVADVEEGLTELTEKYPDQPEVFAQLGLFYRRWRGDTIRAQEVYERGLRNIPHSSILLYQLGQTLWSRPNSSVEIREQAVGYLKRALQNGLQDRDKVRKAERLVRTSSREIE